MIANEEYFKRRTGRGSHKIVLLAVIVGGGGEEEGREEEEDDGDDEEQQGGEEEYQERRCNDDLVTSSDNFQSVVFTGRLIPSNTRRCTSMLPCALGLEENNGNKSINGEEEQAKDGTLERDRCVAKYIVCAGSKKRESRANPHVTD